MTRLVAWLAVLMCSSTAAAQAERSRPAESRRSAPFYRLAQTSAATRAARLLHQANARLREALRAAPLDFHTLCEHTRSLRPAVDEQLGRASRQRALAVLVRQALERRAYMDDALARLDQALQLDPSDPELVHARARVLSEWEEPTSAEDCQVRRRDDEAIAAFERLQTLDPSFAASEVAFQLGLLFTRSHAFEAAATAYSRAIDLAFDVHDMSSAYGNLAEVIMLAGDPARALEQYERALKLSQGGRDYALVLFGAAVALDRLGEHRAALEKATSAVDAAGRSLSVLHAPGVFFEPEYELLYYEALGNEALATVLPETRALAIDAAVASYRAFLEQAAPDNPYRLSAQRNLDALRSQVEPLR